MVGGRPLTGPGPPPPAAGGWRGPGGGEASPQPPSACASVHVPLLTRTRAHGRGPRGPHSNLTSRATSVQIRSPLRCWGWDAHTNGGHTPSPPRSSLQDLPVARPPCDSRGHAGRRGQRAGDRPEAAQGGACPPPGKPRAGGQAGPRRSPVWPRGGAAGPDGRHAGAVPTTHTRPAPGVGGRQAWPAGGPLPSWTGT